MHNPHILIGCPGISYLAWNSGLYRPQVVLSSRFVENSFGLLCLIERIQDRPSCKSDWCTSKEYIPFKNAISILYILFADNKASLNRLSDIFMWFPERHDWFMIQYWITKGPSRVSRQQWKLLDLNFMDHDYLDQEFAILLLQQVDCLSMQANIDLRVKAPNLILWKMLRKARLHSILEQQDITSFPLG